MPIDYLEVIDRESSRIRGAYAANPDGRIPWSDRWSVATVARHVAGTHHVVADIVKGRPDANFDLFATLQQPSKGADEFGSWFAQGTAALIEQLGSVEVSAPCWNWHEGAAGVVGFWARRMAHETLVHSWDAQVGATGTAELIDTTIADDAIIEYLEVFALAGRAARKSPQGPTIGIETTDSNRAWRLELAESGAVLHDGDHQGWQLGLRGTSAALLLVLWGRLSPSEASVELLGDADLFTQREQLLPPM